MPSERTLEQAHKYHVKLTRKLPNSPKRIYKSEDELKEQVTTRKKNWEKGGPKCYKPTMAIAEQKAHDGKKCPKGQERTRNFCVKEIEQYKKDNIRWFRTLTPNSKIRITIACPK
jgi:hypothetical protein